MPPFYFSKTKMRAAKCSLHLCAAEIKENGETEP
uniref:Uncharacterized protein n=1 Tax=Anguilla anguilla TaxID=7936 RepID=A0A0E9UZE9_ANGAN